MVTDIHVYMAVSLDNVQQLEPSVQEL